MFRSMYRVSMWVWMVLLAIIPEFRAIGQGSFPNDDLQFEYVREGLSQNTVVSMLQDKYGFLWIGTRNGLNRYDGVQFKIYERSISDPGSLGHGYVNTIYEDQHGVLWVGTQEGGLSRYNWATDDFTHFQHNPLDKYSISGNSVLRIYEDLQGNFWVGTEHNGLNVFHRESGSFTRIGASTDALNLADKQITAIFEDRLDQLWIATRFDGLFQYQPETQTFINYRSDTEDQTTISSNEIRRVFKSNDDNLWVGTTHGLNLMYVDRSGEVKFKRFLHDDFDLNTLAHNAVVAIAEDDFGNMWFGTENGGLSIYRPETDVFRNYKYDPRNEAGPSSDSFWFLYKDRDGTMWLAPLNRGLSKVEKTPSQFARVRSNPATPNSLSHNNVTRLLEDHEGNLWIGTDGGGLNFYDRSTGKYTHYRHNVFDPTSIGSDAVISIYEDREGQIWVGTWGGGLNLLNKRTGKFRRYKHDPNDDSTISSDHIFAMMEDRRGRFWVGAYLGGLDIFNPETGTFQHFEARYSDPNTINENEIEDLIEGRNGHLWIATRGGGLNELIWEDGNQPVFRHYLPDSRDSTTISSSTIISLLEDSNGNIWAGSEGGGLNKLDIQTGQFEQYTKEDGLPNDVVHGILEDDRGSLWLSTNQGLSRFNPRTDVFRNYDVSDGLQSNEFIRGAYFKTADGNLMFGGINGFNIFDPAKVTENRELPIVHITDFYVHDQRVIPADDGSPLRKAIIESNRVELNYDQSVFHFEFTGLSFKQAAKNEYAFILEGFDPKWRYVGKQTSANYTRVPPGEYLFKVKASNSDGIWNEAGAEVLVVVTSPWWETWWAYLLYTLAIAGVLYGAWISVVRRERLKSNLQLEHLELVKMQEMDQLKSRFFANISHEFRTPLSLILGPLRSIYYGTYEGDPKKQFSIMIRNGQRLLQLINQLLDLSKLESGKLQLRVMRINLVEFIKPILASFSSHAQRQQLDYEITFSQDIIMAYIDKDKLEKIVLNLLSNAFKFTPEYGSIEIEVKRNEPQYEFPEGSFLIRISDTGIGISEDKLNHVFDRFYQVDGNHDDKRKGTGIGLSLTKELVELHGGIISVESSNGEGSTFVAEIPLAGDHLNNAEIVNDELEKELDAEVSTTFKEMMDADQSPERTMEVKSKIETLQSILIIDDNEDIRSYLVNQLEVNYEILECDNGNDGFDMAVDELPDLIISDVMMPGIDGLELCKKIKGDERTCHIPVILLTAKADSGNKIEGFEAGADYYVTKPFNSNILELRIKNILKAREMVRDHYTGNASLELEPTNVQMTSPDEVFLKKALESVEKNMANSEFSVEDFGRELGMSRMQLYRKMKALTGQSANEFIRSIRLKRAAQLIEQSHFTIAEVTYEVGFNDLQYFRDCFKKQFGVNPSKYADYNED